MNRFSKIIKRIFDFIFAFIGIIIFSWLIFICLLVASIETRNIGIFSQIRVGKKGKFFKIYKIRSMHICKNNNSTITTSHDKRITISGIFFRKYKLDELPQLWNVLKGDMSFVGPRPEVPLYIKKLSNYEKKIILSVKPGITGPATLKYRNEEFILSKVKDPIKYNDEIIYPDKIKINIKYVNNWSFIKDLIYILKTLKIIS